VKLFRSKLSCALCLVGLLVCLYRAFLFDSSHWNGPSWDGRSLDAWLADLDDLSPGRAEAARVAIGGIGTNAIPVLISRLRGYEPRIEKIREDVKRCLGGGPGLVSPIEARRGQAVLAFRVLGTNSIGALPTLCEMLTNSIIGSREDWAIAVAHSVAFIRLKAKPVLTAALANTNRNVRVAGMVGILDLGTDGAEMMPLVVDRLSDPDGEIRQWALHYVSRFELDSKVKKDLLRRALNDSYPDVRRLAQRELKGMEDAGESVRP